MLDFGDLQHFAGAVEPREPVGAARLETQARGRRSLARCCLEPACEPFLEFLQAYAS